MKEINNFKNIYFDDIIPRLQIEREEENINYQKAFLDRYEKQMSEFCLNTTTWD